MKKLKSKNGFTLAELLIVVAIIGALVAISIPLFSAQVEKARAATDSANVRAAKAAASVDYMSNETINEVTYYYDGENGNVITSEDTAKTLEGYGQSNTDIDEDNASGVPRQNEVAGIVMVVINQQNVTASWVNFSGESGGSTGNDSFFNNLTAGLTWDDIKDSIHMDSGRTIPPGTLISDNGKLYLVYGNQNWYQSKSASSMADLASKYSTNIEELTSGTPFISETEINSGALANTTIVAGTVAEVQGNYYCAKEAVTYNIWEIQNGKNPSNDWRWALMH